jgi:5'-deoxynucleotidase YfbR-like HD superfamily hydrolase
MLPKKLGDEVSLLWYEYDEGKTKEAKFVKAMDKIETMSHLINLGYKYFDCPEMIAVYANKTVRNFPELKEYLVKVKQELKKEFEKGNIPWKEEYDGLE